MDWIVSLLVAFVAAPAGYFLRPWIEERFERRKGQAILALRRLARLLHEGSAVFQNQCRQRDALYDLLKCRRDDPTLDGSVGYDELFSRAHKDMSEEERELFHVIRGATTHSMRKLNAALRDWTEEYWPSSLIDDPPAEFRDLEAHLMRLRLHLDGWFDKYEVLFQGDESRCLVYLADEKNHGIGFPGELEQSVLRALGALT